MYPDVVYNITLLERINNMNGIESRCYVFVNLALSSIQKGVQGNHACVEIGVQNEYNDMYRNWAKNHKTLIYLQGGFHGEMRGEYSVFSRLCYRLDLPHASFHEDEATMNGMFTAFAGIIPSTVYDIDLENPLVHMYPDKELAQLLSRYRLAI